MRRKGALNRKTSMLVVQALVDGGRPLYLRELIRLTGLRNQTVINVVKTLEKKGFLTSSKVKNRLYYSINPETSIFTVLELLGLGEKFNLPISSGMSPTFEEAFEEALKSTEVLKKLTDFIWKSWLREIENISIGVREVAEFFESNREKAEFLRSEFLSEGVDLYEIPAKNFFVILRRFMKTEEAYRKLRLKGVKPKEALTWSAVYREIVRNGEHKTIPATEWLFPKSKRRWNLPHPTSVLTGDYGFKLKNLISSDEFL
jgi:DNA-binding PadR family transcriptional regulator